MDAKKCAPCSPTRGACSRVPMPGFLCFPLSFSLSPNPTPPLSTRSSQRDPHTYLRWAQHVASAHRQAPYAEHSHQGAVAQQSGLSLQHMLRPARVPGARLRQQQRLLQQQGPASDLTCENHARITWCCVAEHTAWSRHHCITAPALRPPATHNTHGARVAPPRSWTMQMIVRERAMAYDLNVRELFLAVWQLFVLVVSDPHAFHHLPNGDAHVSLAFVGAFTGWTCWNACQLALSSGRIPSLQSNVSAVPGRKLSVGIPSLPHTAFRQTRWRAWCFFGTQVAMFWHVCWAASPRILVCHSLHTLQLTSPGNSWYLSTVGPGPYAGPGGDRIFGYAPAWRQAQRAVSSSSISRHRYIEPTQYLVCLLTILSHDTNWHACLAASSKSGMSVAGSSRSLSCSSALYAFRWSKFTCVCERVCVRVRMRETESERARGRVGMCVCARVHAHVVCIHTFARAHIHTHMNV